MYLLFYRADGTISSVGEMTDTDDVGVLNLTKEQHDEMLFEPDAFIVSEGKPRKRTRAERRARYEELYKRCLSGELAHLKDDPRSILVRWKNEFLPEAHRGTV